MESNLGMFKAYDIRTKYGALSAGMRKALIDAVVLYYIKNVQVGSVVLARDARLYCGEVLDELMEAFLEKGVDVYVNPLHTSTCQFYFMCMNRPESGGLMVTASHNPKDYVGLKLVAKDLEPIASGCGPDGGINKIKEYYRENTQAERAASRGRLYHYSLQKEFVDYSLRLAGIKAGDLSGMRIFAEFLSGAAGSDFLLAFNIAGAEVDVAHLVPDGLFRSGDPNPVLESSIAPAREIVRRGHYDLGYCFDGDGDRLDLMFPDGSQIIPGLNMSVLVPYLKDIFKPYYGEIPLKCFVDVKAIPLAVIEIAKRDIEPHIIRNGHSFIKEKLREHASEGYIAAEEESAHYYMNFPKSLCDASQGLVATENTLFFALLTARALKEHPEEYARIEEMQKGIHRYREWPLNFYQPSGMEALMDEVERIMRERGAVVIKDMDDGSELDATLMRFNLPGHFSAASSFPRSWAQVAQRISRSEDAMARWEVVASDGALCREYNDLVKSVTDRYVKNGLAYY